ncbi:MAG: hypothetical protein ACR2M0_00240 [Chloroflexia bacterium]
MSNKITAALRTPHSALRTSIKGGRAMSLLTGAALLAGLVGGAAASPQSASAEDFANPAFVRVWERSDLPVQQARVPRSWLWGNTPFVSKQEPYAEGVGGTHLVQYFDKSRMEINDPNGDPNSPWYVTNGLLTVEMMTGKIQVGNNSFQPSAPANIPVAGDTGDAGQTAPTYATLAKVATISGTENQVGPLYNGTAFRDSIDKYGSVIPDSPNVPQDAAHVAAYSAQTHHNIPDVFWQFMNSTGLVYVNGQYVTGQVMNWVFALGYPITEPYWTTIRVAGADRQVLVQAFQRRVLTYSPNNPAAFKVEMGNVGRHYYSWRYEHPQCAAVPVRGFGKVWAANPDLANQIGCPVPWQGQQTVLTAVETFEHGTMLFVAPTGTYPFNGPSVFVLFEDGTYQHFDDTYVSGQPDVCTPTPPAGLYTPTRGFGKVWCEGTGAQVRERLGWATEREKGGDGSWQEFEHGIMYSTSASKQIFVLLNTASYPQGDRRWLGFADTYQP